MSEQNTIAEEQQKAYEALAHDFTDFIKAKVRAGENSYKLVNIYKQYDIDADSFDTVKLDDAKAEKLALICMDLANDNLPTYLSKQQQKGCVVFEGAENERETANSYRELRIPLRQCKLEGA